jgi:ATP-dependent Clp protease adaptor protein ClpS
VTNATKTSSTAVTIWPLKKHVRKSSSRRCINDDFTPMEFVVDILESIFGMERTRATQVMLEVHTKGKGICGVYSYEIAETKVAQVMSIAKQQQHPLLCTMEEV